MAGLVSLLKHPDPAMATAEFNEVVRSKGGQFDNATGWGVPRCSWFATSCKSDPSSKTRQKGTGP